MPRLLSKKMTCATASACDSNMLSGSYSAELRREPPMRDNPYRILAACWLGVLSIAALTRANVRIEGAQFFKARYIRNSIPAPEELNKREQRLRYQSRATRALLKMYRESAFLDVSVQAEWSADTLRQKDALSMRYEVTFTIDEGDRYAVDSVFLQVSGQGPLLDMRNDLQGDGTAWYMRRTILENSRMITSAYANAGYLHPRVQDSVSIDSAAARVDVLFKIETGKPTVFDTLLLRVTRTGYKERIRGMSKDGVLESAVPYDRGDTVKSGTLNRVTQKLLQTGIFSSVYLYDSAYADTSQTNSILVLRARERPPGRLAIDLQYETQYGPGIGVEVGHDNIGGGMQQASMNSILSFNKQGLRLTYGAPFILKWFLRADNELSINWYQINDVHDSLGARPFEGDVEIRNSGSVSRNLTNWLRGVASSELAYQEIYFTTQGSERETNLNFILSGFVSLVNNSLRPTKGGRFMLQGGNGGPVAMESGLDAFGRRHNWLEARWTYYYPLLSRVIYAMRLGSGTFFQEGRLNSVRFFQGGPRSIRSFGFREVRPCVDCNVENLRPAYMLGSAELRIAPFDSSLVPVGSFWNFLYGAQLVPFIDAGKVWDVKQPFQEQNLGEAISFGFGIRYPFFRIFLARLDFAWGRDGRGGPAFAWVLDLAQAF
ncbi:MAG: BamA/TamA family outer membrane protein [Chitinivibrionales bacterium]|nr:BamA/TamA family outer membrane protein [Chitinivibrionales bacterium]